MANKVAEIVCDKIMERMKEGVVPWHKPWEGGEAVNYVTQKPYRGINRWLLSGGEYITFKQIQSIKGAKLKKGAKSHLVVFYKSYIGKSEDDDSADDGEETTGVVRRVLRYYKVFSINDCEGIESKRKPVEQRAFVQEDCENLLNSYFEREEIPFVHDDTSSAFYSPSQDTVNVPPVELFEGTEEYYSTAFHEAVHSTGSEKRLKRDMSGKFGTKAYAREELVAEMGAAMLCEVMGISTQDTLDNSTAYLQSWMKKIKEDTNLILYASAKAEKAVELIAPQLFTKEA